MNKHNLIIVALLCITSFSGMAKQDDLMQEVKISAASQEADIKNNQMIFFGPVEVTQGSIKILADELRATSKEDGGGKILIAIGNPATYSQIMEDGRPASASAKEIRYELSSRTLTLLGNATLEQDGSRVTGNMIRYNIAKQQLIAESIGNERVITIIQPESYQESSQDKTQEQPKEQAPAAVELLPTQLPVIESGETNKQDTMAPTQLPVIESGETNKQDTMAPTQLSVIESGETNKQDTMSPTQLPVIESGETNKQDTMAPTQLPVIESGETNKQDTMAPTQLSVIESGETNKQDTMSPTQLPVIGQEKQ